MIEQAFMKALVNAGVGSFIALLVLVGVYRLVSGMGARFIEAQQRQAEALGAQAQALSGLTTAVGKFVTRDDSEHREMLVLLRFMARQQEEMQEVRIEHEYRKKQAHPGCPSGAS